MEADTGRKNRHKKTAQRAQQKQALHLSTSAHDPHTDFSGASHKVGKLGGDCFLLFLSPSTAMHHHHLPADFLRPFELGDATAKACANAPTAGPLLWAQSLRTMLARQRARRQRQRFTR